MSSASGKNFGAARPTAAFPTHADTMTPTARPTEPPMMPATIPVCCARKMMTQADGTGSTASEASNAIASRTSHTVLFFKPSISGITKDSPKKINGSETSTLITKTKSVRRRIPEVSGFIAEKLNEGWASALPGFATREPREEFDRVVVYAFPDQIVG